MTQPDNQQPEPESLEEMVVETNQPTPQAQLPDALEQALAHQSQRVGGHVEEVESEEPSKEASPQPEENGHDDEDSQEGGVKTNGHPAPKAAAPGVKGKKQKKKKKKKDRPQQWAKQAALEAERKAREALEASEAANQVWTLTQFFTSREAAGHQLV